MYIKESGCIQIALGIESNNIEALKEVNKDILTSSSIKACELIKENDIQVQAYVMRGLPNDSMESCISTIKFIGDFIEKGYVDVTHLSVMVPYLGSILYNDKEKYDLEILDDNPNNFYMNCDFLGAQIPNDNTRNLTREEIYALWLYDISYFTKCYYLKKNGMNFHQLYHDLNLDDVTLINKIGKTLNLTY